MNWKKLTLISGVALATITVPLTTAQAQRHSGGGRTQTATSFRGSSGAQAGRSGVQGGRSWNHGSNRWSNGSGRWSNGGRWHHHHRGFYPGYYYTGLYPFGYDYPFGYGYGYGYGYPYYGASASFYANGESSGYRNGGGSSLAVNVQQELARAGYYRGAIDGVIGQGTRRAIRAYERANGLPVDGRIDRQLLETMGLS